jgi:hypothetical protein
LERGEIGDVRDAEVGLSIEIRTISRREVVHDHDVVAACEERIDDVAPKKTGAARHEDTQLLAAPFTDVVDELVEEMVDKGPSRRSASTLAFRKARWASPATRSRRRPLYPFEHLF